MRFLCLIIFPLLAFISCAEEEIQEKIKAVELEVKEYNEVSVENKLIVFDDPLCVNLYTDFFVIDLDTFYNDLFSQKISIYYNKKLNESLENDVNHVQVDRKVVKLYIFIDSQVPEDIIAEKKIILENFILDKRKRYCLKNYNTNLEELSNKMEDKGSKEFLENFDKFHSLDFLYPDYVIVSKGGMYCY